MQCLNSHGYAQCDGGAETEAERAPEKRRSVPTVGIIVTVAYLTYSGALLQVSIALPGSVIANAQTPELKAYLAGAIAEHNHIIRVCMAPLICTGAGQLARAVAIFRADEVVVYADSARGEADFHCTSADWLPTITTQMHVVRQTVCCVM